MVNMNRGWTAKTFSFINTLLMAFLGLICILPVYHILVLSVSNSAAIMANRVTLWPVGFHLGAYTEIMRTGAFFRAFFVSAGRAVIGTTLNMLALVLAAYPLSMEPEKFKGREFLVWFLYLPLFFGGGLIPTYIQMSRLGLVNNPLILVINGSLFSMGSAILLMNFFRNLPKSISESASIDGANHFQIMWRIYIPLSTAALATLILFSMVGLWNEWFMGTIYLNDEKWIPLQTYLYTHSLKAIDYTLMTLEQIKKLQAINNRAMRAAQIFVATLPIMLVYPFLQKYFMTGIVLGSIKE
jgi:ABC-type glycerol-3-phosphate transport system permease component